MLETVKLRRKWSKMMSKLPVRMSHNDVEVAAPRVDRHPAPPDQVATALEVPAARRPQQRPGAMPVLNQPRVKDESWAGQLTCHGRVMGEAWTLSRSCSFFMFRSPFLVKIQNLSKPWPPANPNPRPPQTPGKIKKYRILDMGTNAMIRTGPAPKSHRNWNWKTGVSRNGDKGLEGLGGGRD